MFKAYKKILAILLTVSISCSFYVMNINAATVLSIEDIEKKTEEQAKSDKKAEDKTADKTKDKVEEKTKSEENIPPEIQKKMTILKEFNIIPDYYDYNIPLTNEVSRSDFAASVARMMGKTEYTGGQVYFYDVPKNYWAFNEISNLTEMGILSGSGDKLFNPGDSITKAAAYKMLLCAMGYREYAERAGGYPNGYTNVASNIKLSRGVSGGDKVTLSDMLAILYNALTVGVLDFNSISGDAIVLKASEDETLISKYRGIYYGEGDVNGANTITISGGTLKEGETLIDDEIYKSANFNMIDYLGEKVEFFYEKDDLADERTLLWIGHEGSSQDIKYISVDYDATLDTDTFVYTYNDENDRTRRINIDRSSVLIYNGELIDSGYDKYLNKNKYELKLISNKNKYIMVVRKYVNYVVSNINATTKVVYDKNNALEPLNLKEEDYDTFSIKLMGKDDMSFEDIKKDSVLTVYKSNDEKHIEVYVSNNTVSGKIERVYTETNVKITINGNEYTVDNNFTSKNYSVGDEVTANTDVFGDIVYITPKTGTFEAAFLLEATLNSSQEKLTIKLLGEDSKVKKIKCAEKVYIDGTKCKTALEAYTAILAGKANLESRLALIKKNSDGELTEIDTERFDDKKEKSNSLQVDVPFEMTGAKKLIRVKAAATRIGEKIVFDASTKVFIVPKKDDYTSVSEDDIWVTVGSKLANETHAFAQSYKTSENIGATKYLLLKDYDPGNTNAEIPIVAQKIVSGLDEDGFVVEVLKGYQGTAPVSIQADESVSDLFSKKQILPGDIVTVERDNYGKVKNCTINYDYRKSDGFSNSETNAPIGMFVGYAHDVVDDVVKIGYTSGATYDFAINVMSIPVLLYDTEKTKDAISVATVNDIVTYKNDKTNCSTVFIVTGRMEPKLLVIFK